jgi:hypothetical protein
VKKIIWLLFVFALFASLIAESFVEHHVAVDGVAGIEIQPYFYAWFGFASCFLIIIISKFLGFFLKRREDYYREAKNDK